ncbi:MAG: hypothetical protein HY048_01525 [Acidobacteria bacterium]|nr:hypothetical protein [Acidobacteriota bacterium]
MKAATLAALAAMSVVAAAAGGDTPPSRRESALLRQKIDTIAAHGERPGAPARRTIVTEREVNAYLVFDAKEQLPVGVVDPSVTILGTGRLSGKAIVDLDAVRKAKGPTSLLDPMNYLWGRLPVSAVGVLKTSKGVGRFELESTHINGVPIPKLLLQEIVSYYSRTPEKPAGISLDDPFALPARIRQIEVQRGHAIIVQ